MGGGAGADPEALDAAAPAGRASDQTPAMGRVRVGITIDAPPAEVWRTVEAVERHVEWMADAVAIRFTSRRRRGVGTTFECDTRVGPFTLTDVMEVTEWRDRKVIGVRHVGVVTGTGRFTLRRARGGRTRFTWEERLTYPRHLGGPLGGIVGDRVMRVVWTRNLRRLKHQVEGATPPGPPSPARGRRRRAG